MFQGRIRLVKSVPKQSPATSSADASNRMLPTDQIIPHDSGAAAIGPVTARSRDVPLFFYGSLLLMTGVVIYFAGIFFRFFAWF